MPIPKNTHGSIHEIALPMQIHQETIEMKLVDTFLLINIIIFNLLFFNGMISTIKRLIFKKERTVMRWFWLAYWGGSYLLSGWVISTEITQIVTQIFN